jgi:hypothetical protein
MFVDYWNCYEVVRLRRAITIIFCCCDLFILRRAGFVVNSGDFAEQETVCRTTMTIVDNREMGLKQN